MSTSKFDAKYKEMAVREWQKVAENWHRRIHVIFDWSRLVTVQMLDLAGVSPGSRVLDIAGAIHTILSPLDENRQREAWAEIEQEFRNLKARMVLSHRARFL